MFILCTIIQNTWNCKQNKHIYLYQYDAAPVVYDTEKSNGETPVILELWGMQSTLSLPLPPGPL